MFSCRWLDFGLDPTPPTLPAWFVDHSPAFASNCIHKFFDLGVCVYIATVSIDLGVCVSIYSFQEPLLWKQTCEFTQK